MVNNSRNDKIKSCISESSKVCRRKYPKKKKSPRRSRSRSRSRTSRSRSRSKSRRSNCKHGVKKNGACRKKPGPKRSRSRSRKKPAQSSASSAAAARKRRMEIMKQKKLGHYGKMKNITNMDLSEVYDAVDNKLWSEKQLKNYYVELKKVQDDLEANRSLRIQEIDEGDGKIDLEDIDKQLEIIEEKINSVSAALADMDVDLDELEESWMDESVHFEKKNKDDYDFDDDFLSESEVDLDLLEKELSGSSASNLRELTHNLINQIYPRIEL